MDDQAPRGVDFVKDRKEAKFLQHLMVITLVAAWNPWSVGWLLSPDGLITSASKRPPSGEFSGRARRDDGGSVSGGESAG